MARNMNQQNDLYYCEEVLKLLKTLEQNKSRRVAMKTELEEQLKKTRNFHALFIGLIFALVVGALFLAFGMSIAAIIGGIIALFAGASVYFLLWNKASAGGMQEKAKNKLLKETSQERMKLVEDSKRVLDDELIKNSDIPDAYLTIRVVSMLVRNLKSNQADSIKTGLAMLELDLNNGKNHYYQQMLSQSESLIESEKKYVETFDASVFE